MSVITASWLAALAPCSVSAETPPPLASCCQPGLGSVLLVDTDPKLGSSRVLRAPLAAGQPVQTLATVTHSRSAVPRALLLVPSRQVVMVVQTQAERPQPWNSSLLVVDADGRTKHLLDGIYRGSRPLQLDRDQVAVVRSDASHEQSEALIRVEAVAVSSGEARVLYETKAQALIPVGVRQLATRGRARAHEKRELLVYVPGAVPALRGVDLDTGEVRPLLQQLPLETRDLSLEPGGNALLYTTFTRPRETWAVMRLDLDSGAQQIVATAPSMSLAPHAWPGALAAFTWQGDAGLALALAGGQTVQLRPFGAGHDRIAIVCVRPERWAAGVHIAPDRTRRAFAGMLDEKGSFTSIRQLGPTGPQLDIAGFLPDSGLSESNCY